MGTLYSATALYACSPPFLLLLLLLLSLLQVMAVFQS
jgi:hypothetical protein